MIRRMAIPALVFGAVACATSAPPAPEPTAPAAEAPPDTAAAALPDTTAPTLAPPPLESWPPPRPIPSAEPPPPAFSAAIEDGTRSADGRPGPGYWQQWANYDIAARLDPDARRLESAAQIVYHNRSPHDLPVVVLELTQNLHAPGVPRVEAAETTGGIEIERVAVAGQTLGETAGEQPGYIVEGTLFAIRLPAPVAAGDSVTLEVDYGFDIPQAGAGARMGYSDDNLLYIGYWYPRVSVFDDVVGWQTDPFLGNAEFYQGFGNYHYTVEIPGGWVLLGTGELQNPEEVLSDDVVERMRQAYASDTVTAVLEPEDFATATVAGPDSTLTWSFRADSVRDVAFSATRESNWDATRTPVGDRDGDGVTEYAHINAIYREEAPLWSEVAEYSAHSIDFLSRYTGYSYPWPHMTAVEGAGIIGGGMEFPMMTLMGDYNAAGDTALYNVTAHELAHMWIPMIVSTDERRYSWMDEGATSFAENQARKEYFPGPDHDEQDRQNYLQVARAGLEGPMMRRSDYHYPGPAYGVASYSKPATVLVMLRELLGEDMFERAYREFIDRWAFKHPYPWDLWNTFEDVSGEDLDWFWQTWYHETWVLDQAVGDVTTTQDGGARVLIEDVGEAPMPSRVVITREDGSTIEREVPVETWLRGATSAAVEVPAGSPIVRVEVNPSPAFPDVDRSNNVWER